MTHPRRAVWALGEGAGTVGAVVVAAGVGLYPAQAPGEPTATIAAVWELPNTCMCEPGARELTNMAEHGWTEHARVECSLKASSVPCPRTRA